jgi:hypothetical protein
MTEHNLPDKDDAPWLDCMDGFKQSFSPRSIYKPWLQNPNALAAALRAAADQVVPEEPLYEGDQRWMFERDARQACRKKLLAIADELEAQ